MISSNQKPMDSGFGPKTSPEELMEGVDLGGKNVIVTGGYSGIGLETTKALAGAGARVIVPARSKEKAEAALAEVEGLGLKGEIKLAAMDLSDLATVRAFADDFLGGGEPLHLLINNAGIMACLEARVGPGWESQFATNHLGHFVLTTKLASALEKAKGARVVQLSSLANKRSPIIWDDIHFNTHPYEKWEAYGQSKTANSLFAVEFDKRMQGKGVRAFALHPGGIMTPLQRHLAKEEMIALGWMDENGEVSEMAKAMFKTPEQGAGTTLWCATSQQLNDKGGVYCEDCDIAQVSTEDSPRYLHVAPWAVDDEAAARLWSVTEEMLSGV